MTTQLSLFTDQPRQHAPFVATSESSKSAAKEIEPKLNDLQQQVYEYIKACGELGTTDNELIKHFTLNCNWSPNTPRPRRVELVAKGLVIDSGLKRNKSTVWVTVNKE